MELGAKYRLHAEQCRALAAQTRQSRVEIDSRSDGARVGEYRQSMGSSAVRRKVLALRFRNATRIID